MIFKLIKQWRRKKRILTKRKDRLERFKERLYWYTNQCLSSSTKPGGVVIIFPWLDKYAVYQWYGTCPGVITKADLLQCFNWWLVDTRRSFNNIREMTYKEVHPLLDMVYKTINTN